jgi:glycerate kinase
MKILIAFDSFKGSLTSKRAGELLEEGLISTNPDIICQVVSVADGGEGSLEMIKNEKQIHFFTAKNPLGREIKAYFLYQNDIAYLEMAITSGITLLNKQEKNPLKTNTYGLGQQISEAIKMGFKKIILFAGGSATNDAGLGALQALGFKFYSKNKTEITPNGETLQDIASFKAPNLENIPEIWVATDVTNPFYGPNGATYIYAPQKGATENMLIILENGIKNIVSLFPDIDINTIPGSGAAGGLAGGLHLFLGAKIVSATDILFDATNLHQKVNDAELVITGEGRLDSQSLNGKLISKITDLSPQRKFIIVAGEMEEGLQFEKALRIYTLKTPEMSTEEAMQNAESLILHKGKEIGDFLKNKFV